MEYKSTFHHRIAMTEHKNVLGTPLEICSLEPLTGYTRDGSCKVIDGDIGVHGVCIIASEEFLEFSKSRGNDLSTPMPMYGFSGLKPGDRWCLCAPRWKEALEHGMAPSVDLTATHEVALAYVSLEDLLQHSVGSGGS
ncbi:MAG: DUF2237 domain-containing protein [Desulfocapsaceae bacterium]|nr:DUF2237 domain-containing protein [Desulfocapsaceae bacterium]